MQSLRYLAAAFSVMALASMANVACSASSDIDSGTSESNLSHRGDSAYESTAYGIPAYGDGYGYFGTNLATDRAYGAPAAP